MKPHVHKQHTQLPVSTVNKWVGVSIAKIRVRYAVDGTPKTWVPGPFPRPAPLNALGRGVFFGILYPWPRSGPCPTHTPDGSPLKIGGNKWGPVQGMSAGRPRTEAGWGLRDNTPPAPCKGGACRVKTRPAPPYNEH